MIPSAIHRSSASLRRGGRLVQALQVVLAIIGLAVPLQAAEPTFEQLQEVLRRYDDLMRGESSSAEVVMTVRTERYQRQLRMAVLSEGSERSLVRVLEPAKERGVATLKVEQDVWNYLPKVDRTMKVPAGMMSGSWMGSHFSNDDLVQDSIADGSGRTCAQAIGWRS